MKISFLRLINGEALCLSQASRWNVLLASPPKMLKNMYWTFTRQWLWFLLTATIFFSSCVTRRDMISLNEGQITEAGVSPVSLNTPEYFPYKVRPNDQLFIRLNSFAGDTEEFISRELSNGQDGQRLNFEPNTVYFNSYSVNDSGIIKLPMLDPVTVAGLTTSQIEAKLSEAYQPLMRIPSIRVRLANRRVTLLGEFTDPGIYYLYNEKNTLLEAIGLAGDFTPFANRQSVKLVRQTDGGVETVYLNLQKTDFVSTPYYYVQPNDVIYVEPLKAKSFDESARSVGVVLSGISLAVVIVSIFVR